MTPTRPDFIDVRATSTSRPLKSPRLHVAGEAPPELSPLDAFAKQSRLLAKQLQESQKNGNRVSRLPPLTTTSPLIVQGRSEYFRSMSYDSSSDLEETSPATGLGLRTEIEENQNRPMSMHPRMSRIPPTPDEPVPVPTPSLQEMIRGRQLEHIAEDETYFGARRDRSPSPMGSINSQDRQAEPLSTPSESFSSQPSTGPSLSYTQSPERHIKKNSFDSYGGLVPPRPLFPKRSSSIMSAQMATSDEEIMGSMSTSFHSQTSRKMSNSSGLVSPGFGSFQRSPSVGSDMSAPLPRPSFNFSRPLSRAGTPGPDTPARQASSDSHGSFIPTDDTMHTPISMNSEGFPDATGDDGKAAAPSYIYSKFALPRGKAPQRGGPQESTPSQLSSQWDQQQPPQPPTNAFPYGGQAPPSPPTRPSSSASNLPRPSLEPSKLSSEILIPAAQPSPDLSRPSTEGGRSSEDAPRGRPLISPLHDHARTKTAMSTTTSDSASTIKPPRSQHSLASAVEIPAEDHVEMAIRLHQEGSLKESTYHLRHAAKQGHPTGMLLYALACRSGWGMRKSPKEGAEWLRKAADCASLEIADDEAQLKEGKNVDVVDRKTRKAQFALAIYELGVSYMNGWGIDQDKTLALRCFEIAGSWGDVDALAEAGFCYAQGMGCKKDLKKSAGFYRQAEAKGMSMVGQSWIHKSKYNEDDKKDKKARSKSRTRNLFGLKHS